MWGKKHTWNVKVLVLAALAIVVLGVIIYAAVSHTQERRKNTFISTWISNAVQENGNTDEAEDDDWGNTDSILEKTIEWTASSEDNNVSYAVKKVRISNVDNDDENNIPAYVRVAFVPRWTITETVNNEDNSSGVLLDITNNDTFKDFSSSLKIDNNKAVWGDLTLVFAGNWDENWFYNETDGFFYYKNILEPGESTDVLLEKIEISSELLGDIGDDIQLEFDVLSDSIQTVGGAIAYENDSDTAKNADSVRWKNVLIATDDDGTEFLIEK